MGPTVAEAAEKHNRKTSTHGMTVSLDVRGHQQQVQQQEEQQTGTEKPKKRKQTAHQRGKQKKQKPKSGVSGSQPAVEAAVRPEAEATVQPEAEAAVPPEAEAAVQPEAEAAVPPEAAAAAAVREKARAIACLGDYTTDDPIFDDNIIDAEADEADEAGEAGDDSSDSSTSDDETQLSQLVVKKYTDYIEAGDDITHDPSWNVVAFATRSRRTARMESTRASRRRYDRETMRLNSM